MKQLGSQDFQFLHADSENSPANTAMMLIYEPASGGEKPSAESLVEHVRSRLHTSQVFRRRVKRVPLNLDYPYWVDDEYFDVDLHVQYSHLPRPGTWKQLTRFVSRYHSRPMDMHRPLWEICMVDGLDAIEGIPQGSFALVIKAHHAAVDGTSGMQFFAGLSDRDADGTPAVDVAVEAEMVGDAPRVREMLARALARNVRSPFRLMNSIRRAVPGVLPLMLRRRAADREPQTPEVPATRFNGPVSPTKHFDACWFPLHAFKQIKSQVEGATINDVVLAVCGGALRKYLINYKELPEQPLVAWVPINARPRAAAGRESGGNQISAMMVPLYTDVEQARDRLAAIAGYTRNAKESRSGAPAALVELSQHVPPYAAALVTRLIIKASAVMRLCNLMVTNVPGPQAPIYLKGAKCLHQIGLTPLGDGMGLCIGTPSYNGEMVFSVHSTPEMIPDMDFFMRCIRESFAELQEACGSSGSAGTTTTRKRRRRSAQAR
jgi:diacylglycerol O-acyltransferase / wax synthase